MQTKLSRIMDGLIESIWLGIIIIVPLFFNVFSSRIFEPDKVAILRILCLLLLGVWLVKLVDEGGIRWEYIKNSNWKLKTWIKIPFLVPVLSLTLVYIIATILSISPSVSFWGSYQRMQGLYTTFSYLVIFFVIAANLRNRQQVDRIINIVVVTSLPIALYSVLQRYGLDPVPWEGKVTFRSSSSLGNSIFVSAYIIMAFPLTVSRIIDRFRSILSEEDQLIKHMVKASAYVFIAVLQVITLYLSQSRGPVMGWLASLVFISLMMLILIQKRWIITALVIVSILFAGFLVVFNLENGPLEKLRQSPAIGRFGSLLDPESNSALVRKYIWEGAAELVSPHEPLKYPDGTTDPLNTIRPIVGYGPESMFVAFNPFYSPELGRVERRNASPDRSHNETWDSMVSMGFLGLIVYIGLFASIFYYGFKWLNLIRNKRETKFFFTFLFGGGILGIVLATIWRGIPYTGIGLPFGMVFGLFSYLGLSAFNLTGKFFIESLENKGYIVLVALMAAILAHFIEINFGIAIVATRTYFWVYTGLLFVVGYVLPIKNNGKVMTEVHQSQTNPDAGERKRKPKEGKKFRKLRNDRPEWSRGAIISGLLLALILATLGYDLIGNPQGLESAYEILFNSLTRLGNGTSSGILIMIFTTWIISSVILALEEPENLTEKDGTVERVLKPIFIVSGISILIGGFYWVLHAIGLATLARNKVTDLQELLDQVTLYEGVITKYLIYVILLIAVIGIIIAAYYFVGKSREKSATTRGILTLIVVFPLVIWLANLTNVQMVKADIAFRIAGSLARPNQWPAAIEVYKHVNELAPGEDYYYLSLAGAYFEQAKAIEDPNERDKLLEEVEIDLIEAQNLNPLNTDHTANLARLYTLWASYADSEELKNDRLEIASDHYSVAVRLSPNNPRLWDEWALLYMTAYNQPERAKELIMHALDIDPEYDWTHGLLADYYARSAKGEDDPEERQRLLYLTAEEYETAIEKVKYYESQNELNYILALAGIYTQLNEFNKAIQTYEMAIEIIDRNEIWRINESLARLYYQKDDRGLALLHANNALIEAPEGHRERLLLFISQLEGKNN
jgi:tetratricopeptide (TPR) repeat protein/O-antigen ligase